MKKTQQFLAKLKLPSEDNHALKPSSKRFKDGGQYRIEIPSVEGPRVFREVLEAAKDAQGADSSRQPGKRRHAADARRDSRDGGDRPRRRH